METYMVFQMIWWLLLGVLLTGLAVMVGMDMGVGTILRYVGRSDIERRVALNAIGPHWDGNQVWFVLGGGAVFAAFPLIYATAFSGFYIVMLLLLWSMIVRPLGFEYRSKIESPRWRNLWDWGLFVSGAVPMIVYGAAIGNLFHGVPFHFSWNLTSYYTGSFLGLLNPFAILCGLLSLTLSVTMGSVMLMGRSDGAVRDRAQRLAMWAPWVGVALFAIGGFWVYELSGYSLVQAPLPGTPQTPLQQTVTLVPHGWLHNFSAHPAVWLVPILGFAGMIGVSLMARAGHNVAAWWCGAAAWIGVIGTAGAALFPFLLPSSSMPSQSLTIWNSSSSQLTLEWMLVFALIFVPLIIWYTSWAFWVMRGKVSEKHIAEDDHAY